MEWGTAAQWAAVLVAFVSSNAMTMQWLLARRERVTDREWRRVEKLEEAFTRLSISLPRDYVQREDWIRFASTIDVKLDALREEIRDIERK